MFFVACSISADRAEAEHAIGRFLAALRPGSPFAAAFMLGSNATASGSTGSRPCSCTRGSGGEHRGRCVRRGHARGASQARAAGRISGHAAGDRTQPRLTSPHCPLRILEPGPTCAPVSTDCSGRSVRAAIQVTLRQGYDDGCTSSWIIVGQAESAAPFRRLQQTVVDHADAAAPGDSRHLAGHGAQLSPQRRMGLGRSERIQFHQRRRTAADHAAAGDQDPGAVTRRSGPDRRGGHRGPRRDRRRDRDSPPPG